MNARPAARLSALELAAADAAAPRFVLDPVLPAGEVALVYGPGGIGKSWLALGIACAAATGGCFLGWRASRPHAVLYVDGKSATAQLQRRLALFGPPPPSLDLWLTSRDDGPVLDLSTADGQARLVAGWGHPELVVLDDLASLAGLLSGDADRWQELQRFLQLQRSFGRTVVVVHHANRKGGVRGSTRREDVIDLVLGLRPPPGWTASHGVRFEVHVEKARNVVGTALAPMVAELQLDAGGARWRTSPVPGRTLDRAVSLLGEGFDVETMGRSLGVSRATAFRLQQRARRLGRLPNRQPKESEQ
jgi:putative DNA primase/helicase